MQSIFVVMGAGRRVARCENDRVARLRSGSVDHMRLCHSATLPLFSSQSGRTAPSLWVPAGMLPDVKMTGLQGCRVAALSVPAGVLPDVKMTGLQGCRVAALTTCSFATLPLCHYFLRNAGAQHHRYGRRQACCLMHNERRCCVKKTRPPLQPSRAGWWMSLHPIRGGRLR
jgi:hypothetical protein